MNHFCKANVENYFMSCQGFYNVLTGYFKEKEGYDDNKAEVVKHLHKWFIVCFFALRRFYTVNGIATKQTLEELDSTANKIMQLPYMSVCRYKYAAKKIIFSIKKNFGLLHQ